jgi:deoxyribose-phosphate aldolase
VTSPSPASIAAIIDHTLLRPDATSADIDRLCAEALEFRFAAVCVNPYWVARAASPLSGQATVKLACVVGFPLGATPADVKAFEAGRAVADGATEIDMVINLGALKSGDTEAVRSDIGQVVRVCSAHGAAVKVILETALLTELEKEEACGAALQAGAAFVKTSTGFGPRGATVEDVRLLRRLVGNTAGVKASGGIRDLRTLVALIEAGADRIGTSAGVRIVHEALGTEPKGGHGSER